MRRSDFKQSCTRNASCPMKCLLLDCSLLLIQLLIYILFKYVVCDEYFHKMELSWPPSPQTFALFPVSFSFAQSNMSSFFFPSGLLSPTCPLSSSLQVYSVQLALFLLPFRSTQSNLPSFFFPSGLLSPTCPLSSSLQVYSVQLALFLLPFRSTQSNLPSFFFPSGLLSPTCPLSSSLQVYSVQHAPCSCTMSYQRPS